jgi:hypothetical protein
MPRETSTPPTNMDDFFWQKIGSKKNEYERSKRKIEIDEYLNRVAFMCLFPYVE